MNSARPTLKLINGEYPRELIENFKRLGKTLVRGGKFTKGFINYAYELMPDQIVK